MQDEWRRRNEIGRCAIHVDLARADEMPVVGHAHQADGIAAEDRREEGAQRSFGSGRVERCNVFLTRGDGLVGLARC